MAVTGFVKMRRGIIDHIESGKLNSDESAAYMLMILKANHRTGIWRGSGLALAASFKWSLRTAQRVLSSLISKSYISAKRARGSRGNYPIKIERYFKVTPPVTPLVTPPVTPVRKSSATSDATKPKVTPPVATYQEVKQEIKNGEETVRTKIPNFIFERDGNKCLCCGATERLSIDHILPRVLGGTDEPENLQTLCLSCNCTKGDHESVIRDGQLFLIGSLGVVHSMPLIALIKQRKIEAINRPQPEAPVAVDLRRRQYKPDVLREVALGSGPVPGPEVRVNPLVLERERKRLSGEADRQKCELAERLAKNSVPGLLH